MASLCPHRTLLIWPVTGHNMDFSSGRLNFNAERYSLMDTKSIDTKDLKKVKIGSGGGIRFAAKDTKDCKKVKMGSGGGIHF